MADVREDKKQGGLLGTLMAVLLLTVIGGGAGFLGGVKIKTELSQKDRSNVPSIEAKIEKSLVQQLMLLPPIVANLSGSNKVWARLELSVVIGDTKAVAPTLGVQLADDALALVRTLGTEQLSSAIGFQHFKEELTERLSLRSTGRVQEVKIQTLVLE